MAKIKRLNSSDIRKIQEMVEYIQPGISPNIFSEENFVLFPIDMLHSLLPSNLKFLQESYVAKENRNLLGLISLIPEGRSKTRWKINRLVLNINAYEVGKQLIDYVVNKYGGSGVETFITTINENYHEAIDLFKNACGFRSCTQVHIWENENPEIKDFKNIPQLRNFKPSDSKLLQELEEQCIFPHFRPSLCRSVSDFNFGLKNRLLDFFKGYSVKRWVLDNPSQNSIEGYTVIMSMDGMSYWIDIMLSLAYQEYYEDLLNYACKFAKSINPNAKIYVNLRKYYQSNKKLNEVLINQNFQQTCSFQVLVKDYWKVTPVDEGKKSPIIIFPDITSPACNITRINKIDT